jgi:UDP-N-acetylglucosamine 1-carboxyvinyltransferase
MGADVELFSKCLGANDCRFKERDYRHSAIIRGPSTLHPVDMAVPDIRAGFAYVIAALVATGTSRIDGAEKLDRGYEDLLGKLTTLGADMKAEG